MFQKNGFTLRNIMFKDNARPYAPITMANTAIPLSRLNSIKHAKNTQETKHDTYYARHRSPSENEKYARQLFLQHAIGAYCPIEQSQLGGTLGHYLTQRNRYYETRDYFLGAFFYRDRTHRVNYLYKLASLIQDYAQSDFEHREQYALKLETTLNEGIARFKPRFLKKNYMNSLRYCLSELKEKLTRLQQTYPHLPATPTSALQP